MLCAVRQFCFLEAEKDTLKQAEAEVVQKCGESDVLASYVFLHSVNAQVNAFTSYVTSRTFRAGDYYNNNKIDTNVLHARVAKISHHSLRCPAAFR